MRAIIEKRDTSFTIYIVNGAGDVLEYHEQRPTWRRAKKLAAYLLKKQGVSRETLDISLA